MARTGTPRGLIHRPRRGRSFAFRPADRVSAASGLSRVADYQQGGRRRQAAGWQSDAFTYYESLPPVGFVLDYKANTVASCELVVVDADQTPVEGDEQIDRLMASLVGPRGQRGELMRRAAVLVEVSGEAYFVGTPVEEESEAVWWEFLSVEEIIPPDQTIGVAAKYRRDRGVGGEKEELSDDAYIARFWRSDARYCADEQTEVLSARGWLRHSELVAGDVVMTLNHETGLSEWQPVEAVNRYDVVNEPMLSMEARSHSSLTTLDHRWPVTYIKNGQPRWKTSASLNSQDAILRAAPHSQLPTEAKWSDDLVELVAWYWTEGHSRGTSQGATITQSHGVNPQHVAAIRRTLSNVFGPPTTGTMWSGWRPETNCEFEECGWPSWANGLCKAHDWQRRVGHELRPVRRRSSRPVPPPEPQAAWAERPEPNRDTTQFVLNAQAARLLSAVVDLPTKVVSGEFVRELTAAQLELFIARSIDADGHRRGPSEVLAQNDQRRLEPFELACILAGYSPTTTESASYPKYPGYRMWQVSVNRSHRNQTFWVEHRGLTARRGAAPRSNKPTPYTGTVWCPTTPNGTWLAKRHGTVYFTGNSSRPSCGLRRCLSTCRELVLLSQMTEAIIASRLPMGLLLVPNTIEHHSPLARRDGAATMGDDSVGDEEGDFLDDLLNHLSAPISDFDSASTLVPMVIEADKEDLAAIKVVDLARSLDQYAAGLRDEMYGRLAVGMDVPPEILQGKGGLNHWTGQNVDNEFLFKHVQPVGDLIADFLTYAYLRPMLVAEGKTDEQAADFTVTFDTSSLANNQDDHLKAKDLWSQRLISDRAVIEKQGWDPDSVMPDDDERVRRLVETMVLTKVVSLSEEGAKYLGLDPEWFALTDPGDTPAAPFGEAPDQPAVDGGVGGGQPDGLRPDQPGAAPPPDRQAQPGQDPQREAPTRRQAPSEEAAVLVAQLVSRADASYDQARRAAGNRIIRAANKHAAHRGRFQSTPTAEIPAAITPTDLAAIGLSAAGCVDDDTWTEFRTLAFAAFVSVLARGGVDAPTAADSASRITDRLVGSLNDWLIEGFHRPFIRYQPGCGGAKVPIRPIAAAVDQAMVAAAVQRQPDPVR